MKLNDNERAVLTVLADLDGGHACGFAYLMARTSLDRRTVRRSCRSLARKALTEYHRGLWTEDGEPAGAGYGLTKAGHDLAGADYKAREMAL